MGYICMFLAIAFMIWAAFKNLGTLVMSILASLIVIIGSGQGVWDSFLGYSAAYGNSITGNLLLFLSAALFAKCMDVSGAAMRIGHKFVDWFGSKRAMLVLTLLIALLNYGGVNLWVIVFVVLPIAFVMFQEANLPRHLLVAPIYIGSCTFTMTALPGAPAFPNIFPSQSLGTSMTAAPVLGIVSSLGIFALGYWYMVWAEKKARSNGEVFEFPEGYDASKYEVRDAGSLPPVFQSFIPIICSVGLIILGSNVELPFGKDSTMLATCSMLIASGLCLVLNIKYLQDSSNGTTMTVIKNTLSKAAGDGVNSAVGLAAIVAFGSVIASTPSYSHIVEWLTSLNVSVYWKAVISTSVISGIGASASAGTRLTMQYLSDFFLNSGANLEILHRLIALASGTLDTLPYAAGFFVTFPLLGVTHKEAYKHIFWGTLVIPSIVVVVATAIVSMIY